MHSTARYRIANMDCPMEEALIRKKLGSMPGIDGLEFNLMRRVLTVRHVLPSTEGIVAALHSIDMSPEALPDPRASLHPLDAAQAAGPSETRIPWKKLALAALFAALSEAFELMTDWGYAPYGADGAGGTVRIQDLTALAPVLFALAAIVLTGLGTYRKGWIAARNRNLNMNALMSVAVTGAILIGHCPEAAMVMVLFTLSEAIEARALDRARDAVKELLALAPETATVLSPDGSWEERDVRRIARGSRLRVKPGEKIALDGVVVLGQSAVNQAPITGESLPVEKGVGDTVYAGAINESGSFEFEARSEVGDSTLARIIHAVEEAQGSRAPIQRLVDRFARIYSPAIFLTALLIGLVPPLLLDGAWGESLYTALVVLVIGCPCALVISTPVSIVSGMAAATRCGILIKGGVFLERGRKLSCIALDKTGTLTHGKPRQTDFIDLEDPGAPKYGHGTAAIAASLAARSDHPVSRAIAEQGAENGLETLAVGDFTAIPGRGVCGLIEGRTWHLGSRRLMEELGHSSPALAERVATLEKTGKSVVALSGETGVKALFAVADTVKESSIEAVAELKALGVKTLMLTGDNGHTAETVAARVGVDGFRSDLLPQDKLRIVERLTEEGGVIGMVGDGINDAPALAKAHIGFAMAGGGTDTAMESADVALMDDDLRKIPRFIRLSRATYAILVQNICFALGVKALFFALTCLGVATMWMAVFADVGTALAVVANGLRAMRK